MAHFSEHPPVRARDALDRRMGAVRVAVDVVGEVPVGVDVPGRDLAVRERSRMRASGATKRPSPCEIGIVCTSPTFAFKNQGDLTETIFVCAMREMWRPMVLKVRVGLSGVGVRISPQGTSRA